MGLDPLDELLAGHFRRIGRKSIWRFLKALTAADPLAAHALYIFGIEMPDAVSELIFWYCGDLIDHEARKSIETVAFVRRNRNAKQRRLSWIRCHDAGATLQSVTRLQ